MNEMNEMKAQVQVQESIRLMQAQIGAEVQAQEQGLYALGMH